MNNLLPFFVETVTPTSVFLELRKIASKVVLPNPSMSRLRDHNPVVGIKGKLRGSKVTQDDPMSSTPVAPTIVTSQKVFLGGAIALNRKRGSKFLKEKRTSLKQRKEEGKGKITIDSRAVLADFENVNFEALLENPIDVVRKSLTSIPIF